jgi:YesN/AraC family two-component response regulator
MRVLSTVLVDDEPLIRAKLEKMLDWPAIGARIVGSFADGVYAYSFCRANPVDVVITDIRMPRMTGIELAEALSKTNPNIQIAILSGYADFKYAQAAIRCRVGAYILKPTRSKDLVDFFSGIERGIPETESGGASIATEAEAQDDAAHENRILRDVRAQIAARYSESISLESVAETLGVSAPHLCRVIKKESGINFGEMLTDYRIERAKELLNNPILKIYQVANMVGYQDTRYFSEVFKRKCNACPQEYRDLL